MGKFTEQSLNEALNYARLHKLPDEWNGTDHFVKAIALVSRSSGQQSYVIVRMDGEGKQLVVKDFGMDAIRRIDKVYPYLFVDSQYMPRFSSGHEEDRYEYIARISNKSIDEVREMTPQQQVAAMRAYAIQKQLNNEPKQ